MINRTINLASVEERLTRIETNIAFWTEAQKENTAALSKVNEAIHAIQLTIERQNTILTQVGDIRREVDDLSTRVSKLETRIWWIGGVATAATFIVVNFSKLKHFLT